jgi:hypothetical protein
VLPAQTEAVPLTDGVGNALIVMVEEDESLHPLALVSTTFKVPEPAVPHATTTLFVPDPELTVPPVIDQE